MDTIPREIIVHICSYLKKESLFANIDVPLDELVIMAKIYAELQGVSKRKAVLSTGVYFPLNNLYRTSKVYSWMREYEFVDIYISDNIQYDRNARFCGYYNNLYNERPRRKYIKIIDVNGVIKHSVEIFVNKLVSYQIDKNSNICVFDEYNHRIINGVEYAKDYHSICEREYNECGCYVCEQLDTIQAQISRADSVIVDICEADTIDTHIIMRPINAHLNGLTIEFDTSGMISVDNNPYY